MRACSSQSGRDKENGATNRMSRFNPPLSAPTRLINMFSLPSSVQPGLSVITIDE
ncbi:hypothetical protein BgiMline_015828 [Biomphalaria glabrata]|nr:hypothetical protein BgiMline_008639 [Biomphalaria glabrata]